LVQAAHLDLRGVPYGDQPLEQLWTGDPRMAGDARSKLIAELVSEFAEERVRQLPMQVFDLAAVKRAVTMAAKVRPDPSQGQSQDGTRSAVANPRIRA